MELKDFISGTLIQIIDGISQAQEYAHEHGGSVNPSGQYTESGERRASSEYDPTFEMVDKIAFDVAVRTYEGGDLKGGVGIFVGPVGVGTQATHSDQSEEVSRIQFKVPMTYPKPKG